MRTHAICLAFAIVLVSPFAPAQWVQTNGLVDWNIQALAVNGTNLFVGGWWGGGMVAPPVMDGIFLSTNNGSQWTQCGLTGHHAQAFAASGMNLFAGTATGGVFLSTDSARSWTAANEGLPKDTLFDSTIRCAHVFCLLLDGTNLFAGTDRGVFLSTNAGKNWTQTALTESEVNVVLSLAVSGRNLFAGTERTVPFPQGGGVFRSTNNGTTWSAVNAGLEDPTIWSLAVSGKNLFAGTDGGIYLTTDGGTSWSAVNTGFEGGLIWSLAVHGTNLFAGTSHGVLLSTNNGTSWSSVNTGLIDNDVQCLAASGTSLFAGTMDAGVWRRPLSEMITSVPISAATLPTAFTLQQNYPNPFNPSTTIKFELPKISVVRLSVFDMLGREVSVLVNERKEAGYHEVKFDGSGLSSGVYFYRIQAGSYVETRKLLLLR
jgi:hypothetical protein